MKDENQFERNITKELKQVVGKKNIEWVEWSSCEQTVKKGLEEGEKSIYIPLGGVYVAYREVSNEK